MKSWAPRAEDSARRGREVCIRLQGLRLQRVFREFGVLGDFGSFGVSGVLGDFGSFGVSGVLGILGVLGFRIPLKIPFKASFKG